MAFDIVSRNYPVAAVSAAGKIIVIRGRDSVL